MAVLVCSLEVLILDHLFVSGLILFTKTQWAVTKEILCPNANITLGETDFQLLGVYFYVNLSDSPKLNYDKKVVKIKALISIWRRRQLTPIGRVTVIKTQLVSQLNHLFTALPKQQDKFMKGFKQYICKT